MLARKNNHMWARKLMNELLVAGPFLMLAIISIKSRTHFDPWEAPRNPPDVEARIDAYVEPMRLAKPVLDMPPGKDRSEVLVRVASHWVELHGEGVLKPLPLCSHVDSLRDGVKGQVVTAKNAMVSDLIVLAGTEADRGDTSLAARYGLLAFRLAEVLKYSDFSTVYDTVRGQLRVLRLCEELWPSMSDTDRAAVIETVSGSTQDTHQLKTLVLHARNLHAQSLRAQGLERLPIEDAQQFVVIGTKLEGDCDDDGLREFRRLIVASNGEMPRILTMAKLAWQVEGQRIDAVRRLMAKAPPAP